MIEIESALTILSGIVKVYDWFTGVKYGNLNDKLLDEIVKTRGLVEKLSEHVFYTPSIHQVKDVDASKQQQLNDKRQINTLLNQFRENLKCDILSTAVVSTPNKLQRSFEKDPWEVIFDIRPLARAKKLDNPDALPVIFADNNDYFLGWQMRGAMPSMLDCEYNPDKGFYTPSQLRDKEPFNQSGIYQPSLQQNSNIAALGYCRKCGCKLIRTAKFCNKCGAKII